MTLILAALIALAAPVAAPVAAEDVPPGLSVAYACDGGAALKVAYLNPKDGPSLAVVDWEGALVPMEAGPAASGVRYAAYEGGLVWWSKGPEGTLYRAEGTEDKVVLEGCHEAE